MIDQKTKDPYINVWFGHFYRPAYDDEAFVKEAVSMLKKMGFNSVMLDSKAWEDFRDRYEGKEASQYVKMHEYIQAQLKEAGMSHEFLALYLNADNLYPNIRFSPPIYGESVVNPDGSDGKWYRYWSDKAKSSMADHVKGLMQTYGDNYVETKVNGSIKKPICSMWDPIVAPSFDEEGQNRYRQWLKNAYSEEINKFNYKYKTNKTSFDELTPQDYWLSCAYPDESSLTSKEIESHSPKAQMMIDNKKWMCDEQVLYFKDMEKRLHAIDKNLYLCPDLAQWGYFLNVDGSMLSGVGMADLWDTAVRGIDIYKLAPFVDCTHFISVPVTPYGDPDIYVTACQHNMMRNLNIGREFAGGIYWGRFLYNDIYSVISPCETIASIAASGAAGYTSYGMCGLDDGGVLHRMPQAFNESLERGNQWLKEVLPLTGKKKQVKTAILFPEAMAAFETMQTDKNKERRLDFLGWYKLCCDYGVEVDVVGSQIMMGIEEKKPGSLEAYKILIVPQDDCYEYDAKPEWEERLKNWVEAGGILIHGPSCALAKRVFKIKESEQEADAILYEEKGMVQSTVFSSYEKKEKREVLATYLQDAAPAAVKTECKAGYVYSLGFDLGYSYTAKTAPHVPREQKNNELYPLGMMKKNIGADILSKELNQSLCLQKDIEIAVFENGVFYINHSSYPYYVEETGSCHYQYMAGKGMLLPHSAVFIEINA